jgi:hypothetical protein
MNWHAPQVGQAFFCRSNSSSGGFSPRETCIPRGQSLFEVK